MNKFLISFIAALVMVAPSAEARTKRTPLTPQEQRDTKCQESDLSEHKKVSEAWIQYQKDCAVRPERLKKFEEVLKEYLSPRPKYNDHLDTDYELYQVIRGLLERTYLSLYELERQKVFADKTMAEMMEKVTSKCPKNKNGPRSTFARCFIHSKTGVDTAGGNDKILSAYIASLKKKRLWDE